MAHQSSSQPQGAFTLQIVRSSVRSAVPERPLSLHEMIHYGFPRASLPPVVRRWKHANAHHVWRGMLRVLAARVLKIPMMYGRLTLVIAREDGTLEDLELVGIGDAMVTTAGVNFIAARMANVTPANIANFNFHGLGTGAAGEAIGNTTLTTEFLTTQYTTNNVRPTGTQSTPGSAKIDQTTATITPDAPVANTEWGLFDQAAVAGGVMFDRRVYSVVNLNGTGDSAIPQYQLTLPDGG